jgi:hypothetical protein
VGAYAKKSSDVRILSELYKAAGRVEAMMIRPSTILVVLFGFLQGTDQNWLLVANLFDGFISDPVFLPSARKNPRGDHAGCAAERGDHA